MKGKTGLRKKYLVSRKSLSSGKERNGELLNWHSKWGASCRTGYNLIKEGTNLDKDARGVTD